MPTTKTAIALVEFVNIAQGMAATDAMVKAAPVEILQCHSLCPGKLVTILAGPLTALETAVTAGTTPNPTAVLDSTILPNIHPTVIPALAGATTIDYSKAALGVIETFSVSTALKAADTAAKQGQVSLAEIRLARGMGGKAVILMTGEIAAVDNALQAAVQSIDGGFLVAATTITHPSPILLEKVL